MRAARWLLSVLLFLGVAEGLARLACHVPPLDATVRGGGRGPASDRLAWFFGYDPDRPGRFAVDPVLGWRHRAITLTAPHQGDDVTYTVQEGGIRHPGPTVPDRARVVALGDSFVFGEEVGDDAHWVARLDAARDDATIVNLGVTAYGHGQMLLRWRQDGVPRRPEVVLVGYVEDDVVRPHLPFHTYLRPIVPAERGVFDPVNTPIPDAATTWWTTLLVPRLVWLGRMARWQGIQLDEAMPRSTALVERLLDEIAATGAQPVLVFLPEGWNLTHWTTEEAWGRAPRRWFLDRCTQPDVACVDALPPLLAAQARGVPVRRGVHYTPAAQAIVAQAVAPVLDEVLR